MRVRLYCKDETIAPWKSKLGQEHKPIALTLDDRADEDPLKELWELRVEEEEEKFKWGGKCKGRNVVVAIYRAAKFNGITRIEGKVISVEEPVVGTKKV
jgi:hypothetical protein